MRHPSEIENANDFGNIDVRPNSPTQTTNVPPQEKRGEAAGRSLVECSLPWLVEFGVCVAVRLGEQKDQRRQQATSLVSRLAPSAIVQMNCGQFSVKGCL